VFFVLLTVKVLFFRANFQVKQLQPALPHRFILNPGNPRNSLNLYQYVSSNPVRYRDSYGLYNDYGLALNLLEILSGSDGCGVEIRREEGVMGHEWIVGCGISMGWWPDQESVNPIDWLLTKKGVLERPDVFGDWEGDWYYKTEKRVDWYIEFGPAFGIPCRDADCFDICLCIHSFNENLITGRWGDYFSGGVYDLVLHFDEIYMPHFYRVCIEFYGDCRDFVHYVLQSCCLEKSEKIS